MCDNVVVVGLQIIQTHVNRFVFKSYAFCINMLMMFCLLNSLLSCRRLRPAQWTDDLSLMFTDGTGTSAVYRSVWMLLVVIGSHGYIRLPEASGNCVHLTFWFSRVFVDTASFAYSQSKHCISNTNCLLTRLHFKAL